MTKLTPPFAHNPLRLAIALAATTLLLAGCGGGNSGSDSDDSDDDHAHEEIDSTGRLATYDAGAGALKVFEVDDGTLLETVPLAGEAPRLSHSPGYRYAVVIQREDDLVSFLDGGLYVEDHGDHMHEYAETPTMLSLTLNDRRPTHYSLGADSGVVFFDGEDGVASSKVTALSDASLMDSTTLASLGRDNAMHGVAKLIGDQLFVTYRDPSITDTTLPAEVERYSFDGDSFSFETRYGEQCPLLHGAAANDHTLAFGCGDGVLVIDLHDTTYPASKLDNPDSLAADSRIGTLASHHAVEELVGIAGDQLYVIDAEASADPYRELTLGAGVGLVAQGFDAHGEVFYVLGDDGDLRLFHPGDNWALAHTITVTGALGEDAAAPSITTSAADDRLYLLDPNASTITEIDSHDGGIVRTLNLDFEASGLVWLGLADGDHSHDDHDH
ncbi:hypothetical protein ACJO2E_15150 [Marinobacter sp. M1N3S26]|uniref:hypothetical protein n=1 Tax=Marinobacter sp. M1N3S26 TaxID=3382299 RepID=UPI00387AFAB9